MKVYLVCCLIAWMLPEYCSAQQAAPNYHFKTYTTADGLSSNDVLYITQDKEGYLWVCTYEGLNKFDGVTFRQYRCNLSDTESFATDKISGLSQSSDGKFWVFDNYISAFDPASGKCRHYALPYGNKDDVIWQWLDYDDRYIFYSTRDEFGAFDKQAHTIRKIRPVWQSWSLHRDIAGNIWIGSDEGILAYNPRLQRFTFDSKAAYGISGTCLNTLVDSRGILWITQWGGGFYRINPATHGMRQFKGNAYGISDNVFNSILELGNGKFWFGNSNKAIGEYDERTNQFRNILPNPLSSVALPKGTYGAFFRDADGVVWIGSTSGLSRWDPRMQFLDTRYPPGLSETSADEIQALKADQAGNIWLSTFIGAYCYSKATNTLQSMKPLIPAMQQGNHCETIDAIAVAPDSTVYLGGNFLSILTNIRGRQGTITSLHADTAQVPGGFYITAITPGKDRSLWLGTNGGGVFHYLPAARRWQRFGHAENDSETIPGNGVRALYFDSRGKLWAACIGGLAWLDTATGKAFRVSIKNNNRFADDPQEWVNDVCEDGRGRLWIGTRWGGLWVRRPDGSLFRYTVERMPLPLGFYTIRRQAGSPYLWLLTDAGICLIDTRNDDPRFFAQSDGIANIASLHGLDIDSSGNAVCGDQGSIHFISTQAFTASQKPPRIYITNITAGNRQIAPESFASLSLPYSENRLSFEWTAVDLSAGDKIIYQYRLAGFDTGWINAGARRYITYAGVPPGKYSFLVRAVNVDDVLSAPAAVTVIIHPPWYRSWWFYTLATLLAASLLYVAYRLRLAQALREDRLRNRISQDLHDDVGSALSSINIISSLISSTVRQQPDKAGELAAKISETSEEMMDAMRDIVWSISPENGQTESIISRMRHFASGITEPKGIELVFSDAVGNAAAVPGSARHDLYLIFKEAVNNAVKYSGCTQIVVKLNPLQKHLQLLVQDNGLGFDLRREHTGNGLMNMRRRSEKIGAAFLVESIPGEGTRIMITL